MSASQKLKHPLITGTLFLTAAGILSRIIGFFYRIFLSRTIGAEALGIYHLVFPVTALCFSFTSAGIQTALSRFVAEEYSKDNEKGARLYLSVGLLISCSLAVLVNFFVSGNADFLAEQVLGDIRCSELLRVMTYSLIPACVHSCINGYYYGRKKALVPSLSQLAEQAARVLGVYLIYLVRTAEGKPITALHAVWGMVIGECMGMLVSLTAIGIRRSAGNLWTAAKKLSLMALPLTANRVLVNLFSSVENLLIPRQLKMFGCTTEEALSIYGVLTGMSMAIILFPNVFTNSLSVLLLPAVSEASARNDREKIKFAIQKGTRYGLLAGFAFTILFLFTGDFIGNAIFKNALAGSFIRNLCWICPFFYVSALLNSILHGLGRPQTTLLINCGSCLIRVAMILFLVPCYGIRAYLWSMLISQIFAALSALFALRHAALMGSVP